MEVEKTIYISEIKTTAPESFHTAVQEKAYSALQKLSIPFERVDTDEIVTMEECASVEEKLSMKMVKTLFLCNRQKTEFYLFVTRGDKPFVSKDFSAALGVSRISFAPAELMETMLGTRIGAATVFSLLLDGAAPVRFVLDMDVANEKYYGCSDGTTTCYMKIETSRIVRDFLPLTNHRPELIRL